MKIAIANNNNKNNAVNCNYGKQQQQQKIVETSNTNTDDAYRQQSLQVLNYGSMNNNEQNEAAMKSMEQRKLIKQNVEHNKHVHVPANYSYDAADEYMCYASLLDSELTSSDTLLVTFDYGSSDSVDELLSIDNFPTQIGAFDVLDNDDNAVDSVDATNDAMKLQIFAIPEENEADEEDEAINSIIYDNQLTDAFSMQSEQEDVTQIWYKMQQEDNFCFEVHHMKHEVKQLKDNSLLSSYTEYDVDDAFDADDVDIRSSSQNFDAESKSSMFTYIVEPKIQQLNEEQFYDSIDC